MSSDCIHQYVPDKEYCIVCGYVPTSILIAVLSTYERVGWHHPSITMFIHSLRWNMKYASNYTPLHNFWPAASARNCLFRKVKDTDIDWILMIDNDMDVPDNLLDTLKGVPEDAGIVVPQFHLWNQTKEHAGLCWGMEVNGEDTLRYGEREVHKGELKGWRELTKCGTGAIFVRRSVLDVVPYPWFKYVVNEDGGFDGTEDIWFCTKAREHGVKIYGNASITVGHYKSVDVRSIAQKFISLDTLRMMGVKLPQPEMSSKA